MRASSVNLRVLASSCSRVNVLVDVMMRCQVRFVIGIKKQATYFYSPVSNCKINPLGTDLFEKIFACGTDLIFGCLE